VTSVVHGPRAGAELEAGQYSCHWNVGIMLAESILLSLRVADR
jgi:hypothetical protein